MTPSRGAKKGPLERPKMCPKFIKKLTFGRIFGHFWAPQGGCRPKHPKKVVIFLGQAWGSQICSKLIKMHQNGVHFGCLQICPLKGTKNDPKMDLKMGPKMDLKMDPKIDPKSIKIVSKMTPKGTSK